jgi:hypothetical protein
VAMTPGTRISMLPGAGALFALRAIGLALLVRWIYSVSEIASRALLFAMLSSPWAFLNALFVFLLIVQPGARARAERPYHPWPQWLRQALRALAAFGFLFAVWSIGVFVTAEGWQSALDALAQSNGWLVVAPCLYAAVVVLCRPRALWRTQVAAQRFAIGRYAIALDGATQTAMIWVESRKVGQYDARELSVKWSGRALAPHAATTATPGSRVELLWESPAAGGSKRRIVMQMPLRRDRDRLAAGALEAALHRLA